MRIKWKPLLINLAIPLAVGGASALLTKESMDFYETVNKPAFAPPGTVFPIVWTILFLLMGVSAYLVWVEPKSRLRSQALWVYGAQLVVNFVWPLLFFRARAFLPAFLWLLALVVLVAVMIGLFRRVKPAAGWLQVPYLLWLLFAGALNLGVWLLNR